MRSVISLLLAGAAAAAAAPAYTCNSASLGATLTIDSASTTWQCAEFTNIPHSQNATTAIFRNQAAPWSGSQIQFIVHNPSLHAPTDQWDFNPQTVLTMVVPPSESATGFGNVHNAYNYPGDIVFYSASMSYGGSSACTGDYQFVVDMRQRTVAIATMHVLYRVVGRTNPEDPNSAFPQLPGTGATFVAKNQLGTGTSVVVDDLLLPGDSLELPISDNFAKEKYMIQSAQMSLMSERSTLIANQSDWSLDWADGGFAPEETADTMWTPSTNSVSQSWSKISYSPSNVQGAMKIAVPELVSGAYENHQLEWTATTGAFITGMTVSATFTEYPTLLKADGSSPAQSATLDTRTTTLPDDQVAYKIYQVVLPQLWWNLTVTPTSLVDEDGNGHTLDVAARELGLQLLLADRQTSQSETAGFSGFVDSLSDYNTVLFDFSQNDRRISQAKTSGNLNLAPVMPKYNQRAFVKVALGASPCLTSFVTYTIKAEAKTAHGECGSYSDCVAPKSSHPSKDRKGDSANNDASRFTHCGIFNSGSDRAFVPTTRCYECATDADCGEGQYCQIKDEGSCNSNGRYWCDTTSQSTYRLCVAKSKDVLGKSCRTDSAAAFTSSSTFQDTKVMSGDVKGFAPGYGFCGEAVYYNSTGVDSSYLGSGYDNSQSGGVRKVMWTGVCFNGVCRECQEGSYSSNSQRQCIQGRWRDTVTVDMTIRTFTQNAVAGTTLGTALMVVLLIFCFGMGMLNEANRNREFYGQDPMGCFEVIFALLCFLPCCHRRTSRADMAAAKWSSGGSSDVHNPLNGAAVAAA